MEKKVSVIGQGYVGLPLAIAACEAGYFVNGIDPETYLKSSTNIFDYCSGVKIKGAWHFVEHKIVKGEYTTTDLQHTLRYYISNNGSKILKVNNSDGRKIQVEAGKWLQTLYIDHEEKDISEYNINYDYYLQKINKEIESLERNTQQLKLF